MTNEAISPWSVPPAEWRGICVEALGEKAFRGDQIVDALYRQFAASWGEVTTLSAALRQKLEARFPIRPLEQVALSDSGDGSVKLLLGCPADGERIESVLIPSKGRLTQCISSQVGCNFRCAFCASGLLGKKRNLTAGEIVGQVMAACRYLRAKAPDGPGVDERGRGKTELPRPGNIVVMGMGEPFDNYDEVIRALRILNDQKGLAIGARHITISTCGVVPGIQRLAEEGLQFELSVSLHAPDNLLRDQLMPVNRMWPLEVLLPACKAYMEKTGRIITFEYTLVRKFNDRPHHADRLIALLRNMPCKVNLIPLSPVEEFSGKRPDTADCKAFLDRLLQAKINTTLRFSKGRDVNAACGQLRLNGLKSPGRAERDPLAEG
ncbi:MAG: 23S rRNA (adenine(2503)-C(2))-methyltransferase RlmN [Kiritimatiellae bacterium]|nr:23S rRNA (adenine(2503)-C(2))-methyltransferase RlmN [Kiritimatiellia bacterium]